MIGVEYSNENEIEHSTYEIFDSLQDAVDFAEQDDIIVKYYFVADFNKDRIYREDGGWNYEDFSDTIILKTNLVK